MTVLEPLPGNPGWYWVDSVDWEQIVSDVCLVTDEPDDSGPDCD